MKTGAGVHHYSGDSEQVGGVWRSGADDCVSVTCFQFHSWHDVKRP